MWSRLWTESVLGTAQNYLHPLGSYYFWEHVQSQNWTALSKRRKKKKILDTGYMAVTYLFPGAFRSVWGRHFWDRFTGFWQNNVFKCVWLESLPSFEHFSFFLRLLARCAKSFSNQLCILHEYCEQKLINLRQTQGFLGNL